MTVTRLALLAALALAPAPDGAATPRAVVQAALGAVEGDSVAAARARWVERLRRDPHDRLAALGLATLDRLTYDYDAAERRYLALAPAPARDAARARPDLVAVYAALGWAEALDTRGAPAAADSTYMAALRMARALGDREAQALAFIGDAFPRGSTKGIDLAQAGLDSAARLLRADDVEGQTLLRWKRAVLLAATQQPTAQAEGRACLALAKRTGLARLEGQCLRAIALDYNLRGVSDSGLATVRRAVDALRRGRDRSYLAETLLREADLRMSLGEYGAAREVIRHAHDEAAAARSQLALASSELAMGSLLLRVGDDAGSTEYLARAESLFVAQGDSGSLFYARSWRATARRALGDFAGSLEDSRTALAWFRRIGDHAEELGMLEDLILTETEAGDYAAAGRWLAQARALARRQRQPEWLTALVHDEGQLALARGDVAGAERLFTAYLRTRDTTQHLRRYAVRARLADIHARPGELARAEQELTDADRELDAWRATQSARDLRALAFQANTAHEIGVEASVARTLAALARGGRVEAAFQLAERRRARELIDALHRAEALRAAPERGDADSLPHASLAAVTTGEAAAALPDARTALLEYVAGVDGAPTTIFVLRRGVPARAAVLASTDSLAEPVRRFVAMLAAGGAPRALARTLGAALLAPALPLLGDSVSHLVVVPDGVLHRVPFDALLLPDGRFAVERFAVAIAPSATVARELWQRPARTGPVRLLAMGDPAFASAGSAAGARRAAFDASGGLARLAASGEEARAVARYAPEAEVLTGAQATAAALEHADLSRVRVLHLATHVLVDDAGLGRTMIALAPGGGDDGFVTPAELAGLHLGTDLVVLSACRSAGGRVVAGEGVLGLTAPLLAAGARSVVASEWPIGDRRTVRFVEDFYDAMARGRTVGDALHDAKLAALRRGAPPRDWAAFAVLGDPSVTVPLRAPRSPLPWLALLGAVAIGALAAGARYSRTRSSRIAERR